MTRTKLPAVVSVAGTLLLTGSSMASAPQDRMVLGPDQFKSDSHGAVLCAWGLFLGVQAETKACNLQRRPVDDAIDEAISEMDDFILANSSLHPTKAMLADFKRRAEEQTVAKIASGDPDKICSGKDLATFRNLTTDRIKASMKDLLTPPREPVMNPCV
jgi:hypothetical protein